MLVIFLDYRREAVSCLSLERLSKKETTFSLGRELPPR